MIEPTVEHRASSRRPGPPSRVERLRAGFDVAAGWLTLCYGIYAVGIEAARSGDALQIVVGVAAAAQALIAFLWAGQRGALAYALIISGVAAPAVFFGSAPVFWDDVYLFRGDAFWTTVTVGCVIGVPLAVLGLVLRRRAASTPPAAADDPWWFTLARYAAQGGLWVTVAAFHRDWDTGVPLVYAGAGVTLLAVFVGLRHRVRFTSRGVGLLLLFLGGSALAVIGVAALFVGAHMSGDEAALGVLPAAAIAVIGGLITLSSRRSGRPAPGTASPRGRPR